MRGREPERERERERERPREVGAGAHEHMSHTRCTNSVVREKERFQR